MKNQQQLAVEGHEQHLLSYLETRERSIAICAPLEIEDYVIQTMPEVSPPKWHLAHTSWFFETFLLRKFDSSYKVFHPLFDTLFNSYYVTHGDPYPRSQRGLLSRPTVYDVISYREYVDAAMTNLIQMASAKEWQLILPLLTLGINHEQQHQELLLTDIKHILSINPLQPAYLKKDKIIETVEYNDVVTALPPTWSNISGGIYKMGTESNNHFSYDNESPTHQIYLDDFKLASRCITNREYLKFIEDGGYQRAELWLSDGWAISHEQQWCAPLYWQQRDGEWLTFTFEGLRRVDLDAPVCHVSYFEADAYASWAQKRLPTEYEWELAVKTLPIKGNCYEQQQYRPLVATAGETIKQMFGDVWEWTASPYVAYPGYKLPEGTIGEYNGKFMSSQMVLRGGSFATAENHIRATYRNFFYPKDRWQFSGIRLADDK